MLLCYYPVSNKIWHELTTREHVRRGRDRGAQHISSSQGCAGELEEWPTAQRTFVDGTGQDSRQDGTVDRTVDRTGK